MGNFRNTSDLKQAVLDKCGEVTTGASDYDTNAMTYVNELYQGLIAGGNEFDTDLSEPWVWAQAKRPLIIEMQPAYETGNVTVVNGSNSITFSTPPTFDATGWQIKVNSLDNWYTILKHTASSATAIIDQGYEDDSGTFTHSTIKLFYELVDDTIVVDSSNQKLDFKESGSNLVATIAAGVYTPTTLSAAVVVAMNAAGSQSYTCSFDSIKRVFTISAASVFTFLFASGTNSFISPSAILGFDVLDSSAATSQVGVYPLNGIQRLCAPIRTYKVRATVFNAPEDTQKIYGIDPISMYNKFPMRFVRADVPTRFAIVEKKSNGVMVIRFNTHPSEVSRAEVDFIPYARDLQDNAASIPIMPREFFSYLTFGATHFLMLDKSDNRAESYMGLAVKKLLAMIHDNRKGKQLTSKDYGRLVPRIQHYSNWRNWW